MKKHNAIDLDQSDQLNLPDAPELTSIAELNLV